MTQRSSSTPLAASCATFGRCRRARRTTCASSWNRRASQSSHHYINLGGAEFVVLRVTPADAAGGVRVGDRTYPAFPGSAVGISDPTVRVALFALLYDQDQRDNQANARRQEVQILFAKAAQAASWFEPELLGAGCSHDSLRLVSAVRILILTVVCSLTRPGSDHGGTASVCRWESGIKQGPLCDLSEVAGAGFEPATFGL